MNSFRGRLFSRVVPTVKDIGLWGEGVQKAFTEIGAMDYARIDLVEKLANDGKSPTTSTTRCFHKTRRSRRSDKRRSALVILRPKAERSLKPRERFLAALAMTGPSQSRAAAHLRTV
jgi:hypothetical protein